MKVLIAPPNLNHDVDDGDKNLLIVVASVDIYLDIKNEKVDMRVSIVSKWSDLVQIFESPSSKLTTSKLDSFETHMSSGFVIQLF